MPAVHTSKNPLARIITLLFERKREVFILLALCVIAVGADLTVPFISQKLIDALIGFLKSGGLSLQAGLPVGAGPAPIRILLLSAGGILLATVVSKMLKSAYDYKLFIVATRLEDHIRQRAFEKYLRLHILFHHGASSGQIIGRIERGASSVFTVLHDILGQNFVPPLLVFAGVLALLLFKNVWVALTVFLPLPLYILAVAKITEKIYLIEKEVNEQMEAVSKEAYDVAGNVLTVKKFSQEGAEVANHTMLQQKAREKQYRAERWWSVIENIQTLIATAGRVGVILLSGWLVLQGGSTIGEFVLYVTLQNMAYTPLAQLSNTFPRLRRNMARSERLFGVLDEPVLVNDKPGAVALPPHEQKIEFKDVWFRYGEGRRWVLKNISVSISRGTTVALVGRSGSGKTTFINLLLRSYDPEKGAVEVDGYDLRDITRKSLLDQIAVVPQEVDLFSRTIYQNIAYGKPDVDQEKVRQAAKTALAHDFIMKAEKGYDTIVGERGVKLSGGERQRIGIARAILRDPKILILDEATSHLDTESEQLITKATNALVKDRTTFIIAHRLSTVLQADMILVFKGGEIERAGTHSELLDSSPTYRKLYELQFSRA